MEGLTKEQLVERVAWGVHASRGHQSPRQMWAEMDAADRAALLGEAEGAIAAYEKYASAAQESRLGRNQARLELAIRGRPGYEDFSGTPESAVGVAAEMLEGRR